MLKFIHSKFSLDLENKKVTINEENHWFKDTFLTKMSFPVQQFITREIDLAMGMISDYNSAAVKTVLQGRFYKDGREHEATMELDQLDKVASFVFKIGFEELPNFDTKLAALPLFKSDLATGVTMSQYAEGVLQANDPATPFSFPQIHINSLDTDSAQWSFFEGRLNARDASVFLINEYDAVEDEQQNRNILQPLPTLHHVIKTAFTALGHTVSGDFFDIPAFAKAYIFHFSEYYKSFNPATTEILQRLSDQADERNSIFVRHSFTYPVLEPGVYVVAGVVTFRAGSYVLELGNQDIWWGVYARTSQLAVSRYVDATFTVDATTANQLVFRSQVTPYHEMLNGELDYDAIFVDLTVTQVAKQDTDGNLISTLIQPTKIDLTKCVPDITVRDMMTHLKNYVGLDIYQDGPKSFKIDLIKNMIAAANIIDLSDYEVKWPQRGNRKTKKFILKTPETVDDAYNQESLYVDSSGASAFTNQLIDEDTSEIQIDLTLLEIANKRGKRTAIQAGDDSNRFSLVRFEGLQNQENFCIPFDLSIIDAHDQYLGEIYRYKISGQPFQWSFIGDRIKLQALQYRSRVFVFNRIHVIEKIQRTYLLNDRVQLRLELLSVN
jgi:hypothetical protein